MLEDKARTLKIKFSAGGKQMPPTFIIVISFFLLKPEFYCNFFNSSFFIFSFCNFPNIGINITNDKLFHGILYHYLGDGGDEK